MAESAHRTLVILRTGKQDRGTSATLAFSWACSALSMGHEVAIFMTMEGTIWALEGSARGVQVPGFEALENYIEQFAALDGELLVCAPCTDYYCSFKGTPHDDKLLHGARLTGLASVIAYVGTHGTTVTF